MIIRDDGRVIVGVVAALLSAVFYGVASVLQAIGARRVPANQPTRAWLQVPFLIGLGLDGLGFLAQLLALRLLPVFAVQAALAASLAVTAVAAVPMLGMRLTGRQWAAVAGVCVGLALLGLSAGAERPGSVPELFGWSLLLCVGLLAAAGAFALFLLRGAIQAVALGLVAGLSFGAVALGARAAESGSLFTDPSAYTVVAAGVVAFLFLTIGLQRAAVTTVTAAMVIGETVLPSVVGVLVFGDGTRPGMLPVAVAGFLLAVAGSLALARFGELEDSADRAASEVAPESA